MKKCCCWGEIHHRVKNNLQVISSLMDLTRRRTLSEEAKMVLADARSKIYAMSLVHSQLYRSESFKPDRYGGPCSKVVGFHGADLYQQLSKNSSQD